MKKVILFIFGIFVGIGLSQRLSRKRHIEKDIRINKFKNYFEILDSWLSLKEAQQTIQDFFLNNSYRTAAIYGMGVMGKHLVKELKDCEIEIIYGIDQKGDSIYSDFPILTMDDVLPQADVIIVTATFDYDNIVDSLSEKVNCSIISLEEIILHS